MAVAIALSKKYKAYPEYKNSGFGWLGLIPSNWSLSRHKYIANFQKGKNPSILFDEPTECSVKYLSMDYLRGNSSPSFAEAENYYVSKKNQVLVIWDGSNAGEFIKGQEGIVSSTMAGSELLADIEQAFYWYSCVCLEPEMRRHANGMGIPHVNGNELKNSVILLPSKMEQEKIANFLDHETAKIDTLIEKQQQLIKLLKEKRQAVISHAVTRGLNPDAPMRDSDVEWFDSMPKHWRLIELKFSAKDGYKTFTDGDWIESPYITSTGVRLLQTGNVGIGEFKEKGFRYVSEETFKKLNCTEVKPGDVLICRLDGPVGRSCLAPDLGVKVITSVDNAILKPNDDFDPRFIVYLTNCTPWLDWVADLCRVGGGFRLRVSRTMLGQQQIPAPPVNEQTKIADELDILSNYSLECIKRCEESIKLLVERRSALISAVVTGKIDVRSCIIPKASSADAAPNNKSEHEPVVTTKA